jgi:hypothetical protein
MFKKGLIPAPHKMAAAHPFINTFADSTPPANYITGCKKWSMWLNNSFGDCVSAEECANIDAAFGDIVDDASLKTWCKKHGLLNGADLPQVMDLMVSDPLPASGNKYSDGSYLSVDWTNPSLMSAAIFSCQASVKIGVAASQLESTNAGNKDGWVLLNAKKDNNIDHCVGIVGYGTAQYILTALNASIPAGLDPNTQGYAAFTWGTVGFINQESLNAICGEAYVRNPSSLKNGVVPTPTPTPPPDPPVPVPVPVNPIDWATIIKIILDLLKSLETK